MSLHTWKDDEFSYCLGLLRDKGDGVPREAIDSYFRIQTAHAQRDKRDDIVFALRAALALWHCEAEVARLEERVEYLEMELENREEDDPC